MARPNVVQTCVCESHPVETNNSHAVHRGVHCTQESICARPVIGRRNPYNFIRPTKMFHVNIANPPPARRCRMEGVPMHYPVPSIGCQRATTKQILAKNTPISRATRRRCVGTRTITDRSSSYLFLLPPQDTTCLIGSPMNRIGGDPVCQRRTAATCQPPTPYWR